jgi:hypothetical protein
MKRVIHEGHSYKMFYHKRWHDECRIEIEHKGEREGRDVGSLATPVARQAYDEGDFETYRQMLVYVESRT